MGLQPLEFADCLTDSPFFREKLHEHERELERTSKSIKQLVNDGKELLNAARCLSKAQKTFSNNLMEFKFECIGTQQTDDEVLIAASLKEFGKLIAAIEDERDRMLAKATESFIRPLESFRKEHIGTAKEGKKKFDKQTSKFCASLERYLNLKTKINDNTLQEADAALGMERRHFYQASMQYVLLLQEVQERKKFEFVEILLSFMYSWLNFYHQGHEVGRDVMPYMTDLQLKLQKTRNSYDSTRLEAEQLMTKMLEVRGTKPVDQTGTMRGITRQGYLYLMEKKAISTTWTKFYCQYKKEEKEFMMYPYNQVGGKLISKEKLVVKSCSRKHADSYEKRFCFEITVGERTLILQALSDEDRKSWMDAMDGKEPIYNLPQKTTDDTLLDDIGFTFIKKCIAAIETRGLQDQGLYRVVGVNSKVNKLTSMGLDRRKADKLMLEDPGECEVKTITSSVKNYLRSLPEPLMTFKLHEKLILAAKQESKTLRIHDIHAIIHKLPEPNFEMLEILIEHLKKVAANSDVNLMTVANLGVCFGPTFMRPEEETMASIMEIKFCNIVIEILANNFEKIFKTPPEDADISDMRVAPDKGYLDAHRSPAPTNHSAISQLIPNHARTNYPGTTSTKPPPPPKAPMYANQAMMQQPQPVGPNHTYAAARGRLRPVGIYNPTIGDYDTPHAGSSTSGSSDSLNSMKPASNHLSGPPSTTSPLPDQSRRPSAPVYSNMSNSFGTPTCLAGSASSSPRLQANRRAHNAPVYSNLNSSGNRFTFNMGSDPPTLNSSVTSMGSSVTSVSSSSSNKMPRRMVRTLYHCDSENETELSFEPNEIINNVRPSREPGWLEGSLKGKVGLIPENYVEYVDQ